MKPDPHLFVWKAAEERSSATSAPFYRDVIVVASCVSEARRIAREKLGDRLRKGALQQEPETPKGRYLVTGEVLLPGPDPVIERSPFIYPARGVESGSEQSN